MISAQASRTELIERFGHLTLNKVVSEDYPSIGQLARDDQYGAEAVDRAVQIIVSDMNLTFSGDLSNAEVAEISLELRTTLLSNVTLEGLYLVCQEIKRSDVYGRLTANKVLKAINAHFIEQCKAIETRNYNQHLAQKFNAPRSTGTRPEISAEQMYELQKNIGNGK